MNCNWTARDEVFEQYVRDALAPDERDAFEEHFFACEACFDKLRTCQALQLELGAISAEAPAPQTVRKSAWRWVWVPAAASLVVAAGLAMWPRNPDPGPAVAEPEAAVATAAPQPAAAPAAPVQEPSAQAGTPVSQPARQPVVALSVLARVEPPVYIPLTLRGPRDEAAEKFDAAMRRYADGDFAGALPGLASAARLNPKAANAVFFLAVCQLLTDRPEDAVEGFQRTIALGESPYLEEAHFYLAKTRLRQGDVAAARQELERTIRRRGRLETEARTLLAQLGPITAGEDQPRRN
jgi:tetratricopeptide (TPR) repeat protein